jgi:hypothetical protein
MDRSVPPYRQHRTARSAQYSIIHTILTPLPSTLTGRSCMITLTSSSICCYREVSSHTSQRPGILLVIPFPDVERRHLSGPAAKPSRLNMVYASNDDVLQKEGVAGRDAAADRHAANTDVLGLGRLTPLPYTTIIAHSTTPVDDSPMESVRICRSPPYSFRRPRT